MRSTKPAALAALLSVALATTGMAAPHPDPTFDATDAAAVADAVEASGGTLLEQQETASIETPADSATADVTVEAEQGTVSFSFPAAGEDEVHLDDGSEMYSADDQGFASVLRFQDGAAQVTTVIAERSSPSTYSYLFDGDAASLELLEDGSVLVRNDAGDVVGGVEAPWAYDAAGATVPTRFVVDGLALSQVVDHSSLDIAYPVVADPTYSGKVLTSAFISDYSASNPGRKLSAKISNYGRFLYADQPDTFSQQGWSLLVGSFGSYMPVGNVRTSMSQQWSCHVLGGWIEWGTWDLETGRPPMTNWSTRIFTVSPPSAVCNW